VRQTDHRTDIWAFGVLPFELARNPYHPSLHFRRLQGSEDRFSVRVGDHYRVLGTLTADSITWVWSGTHVEPGRLVSA
jgi:hypothetical protein